MWEGIPTPEGLGSPRWKVVSEVGGRTPGKDLEGEGVPRRQVGSGDTDQRQKGVS